MLQIPNKEQTRLIFKEVYLLYLKYIDQTHMDWEKYHREVVDLSHKYPYSLTTKMLVEISMILEGGVI